MLPGILKFMGWTCTFVVRFMCELRKILPGVNGQVSFYKKKTSYRNLTTVFRTLTTHIACELEDFFFKELFPYSGNISVFLVNLGIS